MSAMYVRTASERDLPALRSLLVETWHATYDGIYGVARVTEITDAWHSVEALKRRLTRPNSEFLVADDGRRIGGMAYAEADESGATVTLRQLYVLPSVQGVGVGGMLLDEIFESYPEARVFRLEVEAKNERAIAFYRSYGFTEAGATSDCGGLTSGIPALIFEKKLG